MSKYNHLYPWINTEDGTDVVQKHL